MSRARVRNNDPKRFFTKLAGKYGPHDEYAARIREKTSWFEVPIKSVRDQVVVHSGSQYMPFFGYSGSSDTDLKLILMIPKGSTEKPLERVQTVRVSARRIARDVKDFLTWFNDYACRAIQR